MITVIVPVYNVCKYLDKCIGSLVDQTYENIEIILIDDGSVDGSTDICDKWAAKDSRIVVVHQANAGVSQARNAGLKLAKGEFLAFVDADDFVDRDYLESLLLPMRDPEIGVTICGYNSIIDGKVALQRDTEAKAVADITTTVSACIDNYCWGLFVWNKLYRRELIFDENQQPYVFPQDLSMGEDAIWLLNVLYRADAVTHIGEAKYNYVARPGSAVLNSKTEKGIAGCQSRFEAGRRCYLLLNEKQHASQVKMYRRCVYSARDVACGLYLQGKRQEHKEWMNVLRSYLPAYWEMVNRKADTIFVIKNYLLYTLMKIKAPRCIVRMVMGRQK